MGQLVLMLLNKNEQLEFKMSKKQSVSEDKDLQKLLEEAAEQLDPSYAWYDQKERRELANRLRKKSAEIFDN